MSINIKKISCLEIFRVRGSLKGFSQLEKLIDNILVVKMDRANKKLFYLKQKKSSVSLTGFTLIELLVAISIFMIGIMGAFSLSLYNLNTAKENYYRVIAADLTREGIELVRNVRDSNWLAREANADADLNTLAIDLYEWDQNFILSNFLVAYDTLGFISLDNPVPADLSAAIADSRSVLYLNNGFYSHDDDGASTVFRRAINARAICLDDSALGFPSESLAIDLDCLANQQKIGLQITARVQYTYGGRTNHIDAVETIYNWRQ